MKKLFIIFILILSFLVFSLPESFSACTYSDWQPVWSALDSCLNWSALVDWNNVKLTADWWFQTKVKQWTTNIALYLWVFAVWSIVVWGLMLTLSAWEEEKVKKAKDIVKWWIIWFLWIIFAAWIISTIVRIIYSI
jgi:hypothetical protein